MAQKRFRYSVRPNGAYCAERIGEDWRYETNSDGEGLFIVRPSRNERQQVMGTCQFSARSLDRFARLIRGGMTHWSVWQAKEKRRGRRQSCAYSGPRTI